MEHNDIDDKTLFQGEDVLIIGNGFDMDLGLKTSYHNFYESEYWPFKTPNSRMGAYLNAEHSLNNWMDLETKLGDYAYLGRNEFNVKGYTSSPRQKFYPENNQYDYFNLIGSLIRYLRDAEKGAINTESFAATILSNRLNSSAIPIIFSFNYTNLKSIAERLGIHTNFSYEHMHGSLENGDIILGVGEKYVSKDYSELPEDLDFLYKTSSPNYNPPQIAGILDKATNITFFGLSLGGMDAPYFSGLFQNLSKQIGKRITFFTYDESSRLKILRHLRNIDGINLHDIWTRHHIEFICTKNNTDEKKVANYVRSFFVDYLDLVY